MIDISQLQSLFSYAQNIRRTLHAFPETGLELHQTHQFVENALLELGLKPKTMAKTGIYCFIDAGKDTTLAFRADMDALCIPEETGLPFASKNGNMHACGHDGHTAMLLTFAKWASSHKEQLSHNIALLFQPAEEGVLGASMMIAEGALENPRPEAIFAMHLWPTVPFGKVATRPGALMAKTEEFDVKFTGKPSHGAMPHLGRDALLTACAFVQDVQSIVSRSVNAGDQAIVSIGTLNAGVRRNIVADKAVLEGVCRCFSEEVGQLLTEQLKNKAQAAALAHGTQAEYIPTVTCPAVVNDEYVVSQLEEILSPVFIPAEKVTIAEDFARYLQVIPGAMMFLGTGTEQKRESLHSSKFDFDEEILLTGLQVFATIACTFQPESQK